MAAMDWTVDGRVPVIWVVDDMNAALAAHLREGRGLMSPDWGVGRLRASVEEVDARLSINFVISAEYEQAGLPSLAPLQAPLLSPKMASCNEELQRWIASLGERIEVMVHGWTHRMEGYGPEVEIDPGGWEFTRRSEWLFHPDPVGNLRRCLEALRTAGYDPVSHVISNCGGRMDKGTLRTLRECEFGVLAKFPTPEAALKADYPDVPEMPWYLEDVDAFIFPWPLSDASSADDMEALFQQGKPLFLLSHGHNFCDPYGMSVLDETLPRFLEAHRKEVVFVRYGDYARLMLERVHGTR